MNGVHVSDDKAEQKGLCYQKLYHASVERAYLLQQQLQRYSELLPKHKKIAELKVDIPFLFHRENIAHSSHRKRLLLAFPEIRFCWILVVKTLSRGRTSAVKSWTTRRSS